VTGGGLPAEIWHEVMVRVEDGLPITPLPMIVPQAVAAPVLEAGQDPNADQGNGDDNGNGKAKGKTKKHSNDPIADLINNLLGQGN